MERLRSKDVMRADQFSMEEIDLILDRATAFENALAEGKVLDDLRGRVLATLFFEPSTRRSRFSTSSRFARSRARSMGSGSRWPAI